MVTVDLAALFERVSPFCRSTVEGAGSLCVEQHEGEVTVAHLLREMSCEHVVHGTRVGRACTMRLGGERSLDAEDCSV